VGGFRSPIELEGDAEDENGEDVRLRRVRVSEGLLTLEAVRHANTNVTPRPAFQRS
jgi:hypothetical protein